MEKKEVKFQVPQIHIEISTSAAILIGASMIAGSILYVYSPINLRLQRKYFNNFAASTQENIDEGIPVDGEDGQPVDVTAGDLPILGSVDAPVTVVEWADYQCPFCERFYTENVTPMIEEYVNTGKVQFSFRDYPFLGDESQWAANATRCANEQGKFWEYHDYLFKHQGGENQNAFSKDNLKKFGAVIGLNAAQFNTCIDNDTYSPQVQADLQAGQDAGVTGTPSTFVNGKKVEGAVPYSELKQAIEDALAGN